MKYLLYLLGFVVLVLLGVYVIMIVRFKKFLTFEQQCKDHPTDENVHRYMELYKKTYIPKQDHILSSRASLYRAVKESSNCSYETKKELRQFFESKGISTFTKTIQPKDDDSL